MSPSNFIQDKNSTMFLLSTLLDFYLFIRPIKNQLFQKNKKHKSGDIFFEFVNLSVSICCLTFREFIDFMISRLMNDWQLFFHWSD